HRNRGSDGGRGAQRITNVEIPRKGRIPGGEKRRSVRRHVERVDGKEPFSSGDKLVLGTETGIRNAVGYAERFAGRVLPRRDVVRPNDVDLEARRYADA